jgi:hypothetical protein
MATQYLLSGSSAIRESKEGGKKGGVKMFQEEKERMSRKRKTSKLWDISER